MDASPCTVRPAAASSGEGPPNKSRHRLWPMIPDSSLLSASAPYSGCVSRAYVEGSMEGHGGVHSGLMPVGLWRISAIWPPSTVTVTRVSWSSIFHARRLRYRISPMWVETDYYFTARMGRRRSGSTGRLPADHHFAQIIPCDVELDCAPLLKNLLDEAIVEHLRGRALPPRNDGDGAGVIDAVVIDRYGAGLFVSVKNGKQVRIGAHDMVQPVHQRLE